MEKVYLRLIGRTTGGWMSRHDRIFWMGLAAGVAFVLFLLFSPILDYPPPHAPMSDPDYPRYTTTINKDVYGRAG